MKNKEEERELRQTTTMNKYKLAISWPRVSGLGLKVWREAIVQPRLREFK